LSQPEGIVLAAGQLRHAWLSEVEFAENPVDDIPLETVHLQCAAAHTQLLSAWADLPEVTPAADFWGRKAGPEHLLEHLPRLETWMDELGC